LDFIMQFLFAFGITFLLPVLLMLLERSGIVTYEQLKSAWRYAVVAAFAISAVLTPPDVVSQFILAVPLIALYALSIVGIWFTRRRKRPVVSSEIEAISE
ncbi:MAG: twin-arginine translocase subunit TatC, partial [Alphaproteobacteria bacterium]